MELDRKNADWRHIAVDMQRLFAEDTPWYVEWLSRIAPNIVEISSRFPRQTVFTRFITPEAPEQMHGAWQDYYHKWQNMTRSRLAPELLHLIEPLARLVPPARVFDKPVYSPWFSGELHRHLQPEGVRQLVVTGGETDVCVLATVLGAIDLGYRVTLITDAVCSGADATHDASLTLLSSRFSIQVEVMTTAELVERLA